VISPFVPLVDLVFLVVAFFDLLFVRIISGHSLMYLAGFGGSLRGKFGVFQTPRTSGRDGLGSGRRGDPLSAAFGC
jgi:hypothetical protein